MKQYRPQKIEKKWQKDWQESKIYKTPNKAKGKKNFYHLVMLPYSSGDLHIGHWFSYAPADVYARFKRMFTPHRARSGTGQGFNVLSPIGFDAFGLPAENAAIKRGIHPKTWTYQNIAQMRKQLKSIGTLYDWTREIITCEPDYYRWTQWMFLQLYKAGLAYRAKVAANWCPSCKTILANEQVVEGKCERCDSEVLQKEIEQWLLKITDYAEPLLKDLDNLDWPERTKIMQRNWIGKSRGYETKFKVQSSKFKVNIFTTRIDTIFGCTYLVLAPENSIIEKLKDRITNYQEVKKYIEESKKKTERERLVEARKKTGVEIKGIKAINPANNEEIPIWTADYVLMGYGTGAIMAVPEHDKRDREFAKKYKLLIKKTKLVDPVRGSGAGIEMRDKQTSNGVDPKKIAARVGAKQKINYKIRDWIISRQRYWGAPIPIIYCRKCWEKSKVKSPCLAGRRACLAGRREKSKLKEGTDYIFIDGKEHMVVQVPEKNLPVLLPKLKDFKPNTEGKSPLAKSEEFVKTKCPKCRGPAQRETDTMDTFVCSSWYYLRYTDPKNNKKFADPKKLKAWLPVDIYIGGAEHTVMHLLYARFFAKALKKLGLLHFSEPFLRLRHQGIILGPDGQKMSKSKGNVVDPDQQVKKYGADVVRMYLCFMGPYHQGGPWNPKGIQGISRFLNKVWNLRVKNPKSQTANPKQIPNPNDQKIKKLLHKTIKKITEDIENFRFNTAISALMVLVNEMQKQKNLHTSYFKLLTLLLAPFAPHLTEELWHKLGHKKSIHLEKWPRYDPALIKEETLTLVVQVNGRVRGQIETEAGLPAGQAGILQEKAKALALSNEKVAKWIVNKRIKKIIFVPHKLINIVTE